MGLKPSSNGQLMKTDLEAGGLAVGRFATRLLGLAPQRIEEGLGTGTPRSLYLQPGSTLCQGHGS
jgi:hypothetical protein